MKKYKGYEICNVTESYLKCYGGVLFSLPEEPGDYAKDVDDAKRKIDLLVDHEDGHRFGDDEDRSRNEVQSWDRDEIRHYGKSNWDY